MQKRYSLPASFQSSLSKEYLQYPHCLAKKQNNHSNKGICKCFIILLFLSVIGCLAALLFELINHEYKSLKFDIQNLQKNLKEKEEKIQKIQEAQTNEATKIQKQLHSLIEALSVYSERKVEIDEEKTNQTINFEKNLELLKKDLIYSLQYYLVSFYQNVFVKDLQKEHNKMMGSYLKIENFVLDLAQKIQPFEQMFNVFNIADSLYGSIIIKYDKGNITLSTSSFQFKTNLLHFFDQFSNIDNLISMKNDFTNCYQAFGGQGKITIQLKEKSKIFAFSYEHRSNGEGDFDAVRNLQIYGILDEFYEDPLENLKIDSKINGYFLGSYYFSAGKISGNVCKKEILDSIYWKFNSGNRFKQYFICIHENFKKNSYKMIRIEYENYGNTNWTCLYKFEVFSKITEI